MKESPEPFDVRGSLFCANRERFRCYSYKLFSNDIAVVLYALCVGRLQTDACRSLFVELYAETIVNTFVVYGKAQRGAFFLIRVFLHILQRSLEGEPVAP